jgi:outer membrane protein OmpA-like peptidoglycan-associated protein
MAAVCSGDEWGGSDPALAAQSSFFAFGYLKRYSRRIPFMCRVIRRAAGVLILVFLLAPAGFAKGLAAKPGEDAGNSADAAVASTSASSVSPDPANANESPAPDATSTAAPASSPAEQGATSDKKTSNEDEKPAPKFTPVLATTGTLGLFTLETAETLPKRGLDFSAFGNKFGRMPGSVTILQIGLDMSYGITDNLNFYAAFDPYQRAHIGCPGQLSLRSIPLSTCVPQSFGVPGSNSFFPSPAGSAPGYVEDYPFAANNTGGLGNITLGLKYALLSERHGAPVSFSVRNDFNISTRTDVNKLLANGTQGSPVSDLVSAAISRQWSNIITATFNVGYWFGRDPRDTTGNPLFNMANQVRTGFGFISFPESRFQLMTEYSAVIFTSAFSNSTPDTSFGARDPIDGIWGVRVYPWKHLGIDVGYRRMLNLRDLNDRNGFVVKVGAGFWPEKTPPVNHPPTVSCSADKSMVYLDSGDAVAITCTASDPDNDPLTYTWSQTCGKVDGSGSQVRWLSAGVPVGPCAITAKVDDGRGGFASSSVSVRVDPKPNHPPTITCSADRTTVFSGEKVHITTNASDPDGDPLKYTWTANAGQIVGSGAAVDFDTTGLAPGTYTVTVRVDDGRGGAADCSSTVEVKAVPPPPQASKISDCAFGKPLSTRIDNSCKRFLDDVALRLQSEPRGSAVIIGYSDPKEAKPAKVAGDRATNAVKYLGEKGIDASRVATRTGSGQAGAGDNRRIDVIWVPEGATF